MKNDVLKLIEKAKVNLRGAERDFNAGDYTLSVSRSYYAMFTAARALLLKKGIRAKTHKGVLKKFGEEYIKTGLFPVEIGKEFKIAQRAREISDYGTSIDAINKEKAVRTLYYARRFVEEAEKYLEKGKEESMEKEEGNEMEMGA